MPASSASPAPESTAEALNRAAEGLRGATDVPRLEAELLLAHLLDCPRTSLLAHPERRLDGHQARTYRDWIARRAAGEPLPYIIGRAEFYGRDFAVTRDVLIPRPETELLVEEALAWLRLNPARAAADVGTGSGCIAVTLAAEAPALHTYAVDISAAALDVARANAERHAVAGRITFLHGDLLAPLPAPVDLLLSNPPYVAAGEWEALPPSVRREPRTALISGTDGLDAVRRILDGACGALRPGGLLLVEIGAGQGAAARALARAAFPEADVEVLRDLAGRDRLLRLGRPAPRPERTSR